MEWNGYDIYDQRLFMSWDKLLLLLRILGIVGSCCSEVTMLILLIGLSSL